MLFFWPLPGLWERYVVRRSFRFRGNRTVNRIQLRPTLKVCNPYATCGAGAQQQHPVLALSDHRSLMPTGLLFALLIGVHLSSASAQSRSGVPSAEKQKAISKTLEDTYAISELQGIPKKIAATNKLVEASRDTELSKDELYVILMTVITLTKDTGEFAKWSDAVNALTDTFELDPLGEKLRLLTEFMKSNNSAPAVRSAIDAAISLAGELAAQNRFTEAISVLATAETAASRTPKAEGQQKNLTSARDRVAGQEKDWMAFQVAMKALEMDRDDPMANFTAGQWYAVHEKDWPTALPFLEMASEQPWKAAATLERNTANEGTARFSVANAWWEIGEKESGAVKAALLLHAGGLYQDLLPQLSSLEKKLAGKRLEQLPQLLSATRQAPKEVADPNAATTDKALEQYRRDCESADRRLLAAFDRQIEAINASKLKPDEKQTLVSNATGEKTMFEQHGTIPFSSAMRKDAKDYLKALADAQRPLSKAYDKLISQLKRAKNHTAEQQKIVEKSAVLKPKIVGAWHCNGVGNGLIIDWVLYSDGTAGKDGATWELTGKSRMVIVNPNWNSPPGGWIDTCEIDDNGQTFLCTNQRGGKYTGRRAVP